jgi:hypothetical protein
MEITTTAHTNGSGAVDRVDIVANGTAITIAETSTHALSIVIVDATGGRITNLTICNGPSGGED